MVSLCRSFGRSHFFLIGNEQDPNPLPPKFKNFASGKRSLFTAASKAKKKSYGFRKPARRPSDQLEVRNRPTGVNYNFSSPQLHEPHVVKFLLGKLSIREAQISANMQLQHNRP